MATQNKSTDNRFAQYKSNRTWEKNRKAKLERTLKAQPNNEQVKNALKQIVYRRKTPNTRVWSASWIKVAKLFKLFEGRFDPNIMSANQELARAALSRQSKVSAEILKRKEQPKNPDTSKFFTLEARLQGIR